MGGVANPSVRQGSAKAEEAISLFHDLVLKFGESVLLLNGLANGMMIQGDFAGAEATLKKAMSQVSCVYVFLSAHSRRR